MLTSGLGSAADAAAETAILSTERRFFVDLKVDWLRNGEYGHSISDLSQFADDITVDRNLAGTAPAELMLIEGGAAAQLSFTVGGEWYNTLTARSLPFPGVFSPYNGFSPLYNLDPIGCDVIYKLGVETPLGVIWYQQFVGNIRTINSVRGDAHNVAITALDRAEKMRVPVRMPVWSVAKTAWIQGWREAQCAYSSWVIDHALRAADVSTTPLRWPTYEELEPVWVDGHWGMQFWLTGNGSWIPSIGVMNNARVQGFPKSEATGTDMYSTWGDAHPSVKTEVEASGKRPFALNATKGDLTGPVPSKYSISPTARTEPNAQRAFFLSYLAGRNQELFDDRTGTHRMGFTLITRGDSNWWQTYTGEPLEVHIGGQRSFRIHFNGAGQVRAELWKWQTNVLDAASAYVTIPTGMDSVEIEAQLTYPFAEVASTRRLGIRAHTTESTFGTVAAYSGDWVAEDGRLGVIFVQHQVAMQDVFWSCMGYSTTSWSKSNFGNNTKRSATYGAVLDKGLNNLTVLPAQSYDDAWALVTEVASAEMGAVFWDEKGVFRFWNRDTITAKQDAAVRSYTLDEPTGMGITVSSDSTRNSIDIQGHSSLADETVVYEIDSDPGEIMAAPGADTWVEIESLADTMAIYPGKLTRVLPSGGSWSAGWNHHYMMQAWTGSTWEWRPDWSGVDLTFYNDDQGRTWMHIWNGWDRYVTILKARVTGTKLVARDIKPMKFYDTPSQERYGTRTWSLAGDWITDQPVEVHQLGSFLLDRTKKPIPATDQITVAGDPRIQLADCIDVRDPAGFGELIRLQILGITRSYSRDGGLTDTYSVEMIQPPGLGIWDSDQRGQWDITFRWSD